MKGENNAFLIYQDDKGVLNVNAVRELTEHDGEPIDGYTSATSAPREA